MIIRYIQDVWISLDNGIRSTVGIFVPAVSGSDLEFSAQCCLGGLYFGIESIACEVFSVQCLRADGYSIHLISVAGCVGLDGC